MGQLAEYSWSHFGYKQDNEVMIIGGVSIYNQFLNPKINSTPTLDMFEVANIDTDISLVDGFTSLKLKALLMVMHTSLNLIKMILMKPPESLMLPMRKTHIPITL